MVLLLLAGCDAFTDGATRLSAQIVSEAAALQRGRDARITVVHRPERIGNTGCAEAYTVQFDKVGALVIWCKASATGKTTHSHSTSSHAREVDTRETWVIDKARGEALTIDIARGAGNGAKPVIVGVR